MESNIFGMALLDQIQQPVIFEIPGPRYIRWIGLLPLASVVGPIAFICSKRGVAWTLQIFDPLASRPSFFLTASMALALAFALWILFRQRSSFGRFEFARGGIRFIPNRVMRLIGEPATDVAITPQSAEIVLCHSFWQERPNGWRIIVRTASGSEHQLGSNACLYLNIADVKTLADAITPATGLPVRVVVLRTPLHGALAAGHRPGGRGQGDREGHCRCAGVCRRAGGRAVCRP